MGSPLTPAALYPPGSFQIDRLRAKIADTPEFAHFDPMPLPLDPEVLVTGIDGPSAHVFKSAMMPLGLTFRTVTGGEYKIIFKAGDDLRQDQLILQQILLMDRLLKRENLDLMLTPYKCLATRCAQPAQRTQAISAGGGPTCYGLRATCYGLRATGFLHS